MRFTWLLALDFVLGLPSNVRAKILLLGCPFLGFLNRNNSVNHPTVPQQMKPVIYNRAGKACALRPNMDMKKPKKKNTGRRGDRSDVSWQVQAVESLAETLAKFRCVTHCVLLSRLEELMTW